MPTSATVDGVVCTLEKLTDGSIRVTHVSVPVNACHGPATDGEVMYVVHPVQRQQYQYLNNLLPAADRRAGDGADARPWWSYVPGKREGGPGKDDAGE